MNGAGFYERWLRGLKGGPLVTYAAGAAAALWTFLQGYAPGMPERVRLLACGAAFLVAALLFFLNPKALDWVPPGGDLTGLIEATARAIFQEEGFRAKASAARAARLPDPPPVASRQPPAMPEPPRPSAPPEPTAVPVGSPMVDWGTEGERTLNVEEALALVAKSLEEQQKGAVVLQQLLHRIAGEGKG